MPAELDIPPAENHAARGGGGVDDAPGYRETERERERAARHMSSLITASIVRAPSSTLKPNPAGPTRRLGRPEIRKSFNGGARGRAAAAAAGGGGWMDGMRPREGRRRGCWRVAAC